MKKVLLSLLLLFSLNAQFVVGANVALTDPTLIGGFVEYKASEMNDLDIYGHVGAIFGSEDFDFGFAEATFNYTFIEVGSSAHYPFNDDMYGVGKLLYSIGSVSVDGSGVTGSVDSELTIMAGAGYKLDNIMVEAMYAFTGLDGLRLMVGYSF